MAPLIISMLGFVLNVSSIHKDLENIMKSEKQLNFHIENIKNDSSPVLIAYRGLFKTAYAEHVFWPTTKLLYFNDGKDDIEQQISKNPDLTELYFIRLMVQLNAPSFLGYQDDMDDDLYKVVNCTNKNLKSYMIGNLKKVKNLNKTQSLILNNIN